MVVPLLLLGTFAKLALAATVTYRTRLWWLPAVTAIVVGAGALLVLRDATPHTVGAGSMALGAIALVIGSLLRPRA